MKKHAPNFLKLVMKAQNDIHEIKRKELKKQIQTGKDLVLIDIREKEEWLQGHIPRAIHLSKGIIERDIERIIPNLSAQIIVYCSGGFRSVLTAQSLQNMGYKNVFSLEGGFTYWHASL